MDVGTYNVLKQIRNLLEQVVANQKLILEKLDKG